MLGPSPVFGGVHPGTGTARGGVAAHPAVFIWHQSSRASLAERVSRLSSVLILITWIWGKPRGTGARRGPRGGDPVPGAGTAPSRYLEAEDDGPDEAKGEAVVAVHDVVGADVLQVHPLLLEELQRLVHVLQGVDPHPAPRRFGLPETPAPVTPTSPPPRRRSSHPAHRDLEAGGTCSTLRVGWWWWWGGPR